VQQELFHRHGRRLTLTPAGEVMLGFSRQILSLHDEALAAVSMGLEGIGKMLDRVEKVLPPFSDHPPIGG
jgi:DNA-binding transcriptional LysR family regulator